LSETGVGSEGAAFWHIVPLHYVPHLLAKGALYSQERLTELRLPLHPRASAFKRDRKLRLDGFVHLSLRLATPLLADKRRRGYPHVAFGFDASIADTPGAAYLRYNPKSWRHRDDFAPVVEADAKREFVAEWAKGAYPSGELLIPGALTLAPLCKVVLCASDEEAGWLNECAAALQLEAPAPLIATPSAFPAGVAPDLEPHRAYLAACRSADRILDPPDLPFD
jgi:hypothetical protein